MTTQNKVIICVSVVVVSFAAGRYTVPQKVITETKVVEVEKKTEEKKQDIAKNTKKKTKTVETFKPNGEKTITTVTVEEATVDKKTDKTTTDDKTTNTETKKEVIAASDKVTVGLLGGAKLIDPGLNPLVYGAMVSKPIIGPLTVGAWGLNNGTFGMILGVTF